MTKIFRSLTLAALAGTLLGSYAFAQSASTGAMSSSDHMSSGSMTSRSHGHMSGNSMASKKHHAMSGKPMRSAHMMMNKKGKKSGQMAPHDTTGSH